MSNEMKDWLADNEQEKQHLLNTVQSHMDYAASTSERPVMFAALYGSQNYNLATPESDVDTKVWLMPSLSDLYMASKPYSKELSYNDAHVEAKDYRLMLNELRKQNMNFLETIFTPYVVVKPRYQEFYNLLHDNRELIARMDVNRGVHAFMGHMSNMYNRFKRDETPKQIAHLIRLYDCLQRYALTDEPYEELLFNPHSLDYLMAIRRGEVPLDQLHDIAETYMGLAKNIVDETPKTEPNKQAESVLRYAAATVLLKKFE